MKKRESRRRSSGDNKGLRGRPTGGGSLVAESGRIKSGECGVPIARMVSFAEQNPLPVLEIGPDDKLSYANPAALATWPDLAKGSSPAKLLGLAEETLVKLGPGKHVTQEVRVDGKWLLRNMVRAPDGRHIRLYHSDITDLKQNEDRLKLLQMGVQRSADAIFTTDFRGTINYVNPAFEKLYGWSAAEVVGKSTPRILKSGKLTGEDYKIFWQTLLNGDVVKGEMTNKTKDGRFVTVSGSANPVTDDKDGIIGFMGIQHDISERKAAADELRFKNVMLSTQQEASIDGILVVDEKREIISYNRRFVEIWSIPQEVLGTRSDELVLKSVLDRLAVPQEFLDRVTYLYAHTDEVSREEIRLKDGRTLDRYSAPIISSDKKYYGRVWYFRDVTDSKKAKAALAESEKKYRSLIESSPDCIKLLDLSGNLLHINTSGLKEHGFKSLDEALGGWNYLGTIDEAYRPGVLDALKAAIAGEVVSLDVKHITSGVPGAANRDWCNITFSPVKDTADKTVNVLAVSRDITARKLAEARVEESNYLRNKFIRIVSHQFRTPLNAIRWNLEALLADEVGKLEPTQKRLIHVVHDANLVIISRIHDLLTVMDIEEGRVSPQKDDVMLESLFSSVNIDLMKKCQAKNITCRYQRPESPLPMVLVDAEKIRAAMVSLTDNAVIYTAENGTIDVSLRQSGGALRFSVRDTGIGIPTAEQPYIFTRFFRTSNAPLMLPDASGLGLFIAKKFVDQHGGRIGFESEEGKGSTFWFELPLTPPPRPPAKINPLSAASIINDTPPGKFFNRTG